jgi:DNA polymerase
MDESRRRAYLEAMGVPVWVPRAAPPAPAVPASAAAGAAVDEGEASGEERPAVEAPAASADAALPVANMDAETLRRTILGCTACGLCATRTQAVPGVGHLAGDLLVIGEAPGQAEDRRGEPFVGRAGQLLDRMLAAIGLDRGGVFITNVLKCRPPDNRDPHADEVQACAPYLRRQIELIGPKAILAVGRVSAQQLLETGQPIARLRGQWHRYGPQDTPLRVTYHPAYLLRSPREKARAWADLKAVRAALRA